MQCTLRRIYPTLLECLLFEFYKSLTKRVDPVLKKLKVLFKGINNPKASYLKRSGRIRYSIFLTDRLIVRILRLVAERILRSNSSDLNKLRNRDEKAYHLLTWLFMIGTRIAVCKLPEHATACYQTFIQWNHFTWVLVSTPCTGLCDGRVSKQ